MDSGDEILFVRRHFSLENNSQPESKDSPVVISDCDEDDSMVSADSGNQPDSLIPGSKPLDPSTAKNLKKLLFGSSTTTIGSEWQDQYFEFDSTKELWYGLVQKKGGPCGILAVVQGYLLAEIFHRKRVAISAEQTDQYLYHCLAYSLADILCQIGGHRHQMIVAFESTITKTTTDVELFEPDGITEHIHTRHFTSAPEVYQFLTQLFDYNRRSVGCVSFAYSCILTRGLEKIQADPDGGSFESLITNPPHRHCTQELVNLCLIGRAVSNVFDRSINCDDIRLQGINRQAQIGFLTLHEHVGDFQVGSCYKNPLYPIYVILSEYHFTILFSKAKLDQCGQFELCYYDGLMNQDQEILLEIDLQSGSILDRDSTVPLECIIRTKWPNAVVHWRNGMRIF